MTDEKHNAGTTQRLWTSQGAQLLGTSESAVLMLIGVALVLVAVLLLYSSMHDLYEAVYRGPGEIEHKAVEILNTVSSCHDDDGDRIHGGNLAEVTYSQR